MRFALKLESSKFFFNTLSDMTNSLSVANSFAPFKENCEFRALVAEGDKKLDLVIQGIKFEDHISFGLDDKSRKNFDEFCEMIRRDSIKVGV